MALTTTGNAPVNVGSSSRAFTVFVTKGNAPVSVGSSSRAISVSIAKGTSPVGAGSSSRAYISHNFTAYPGEAFEIQIPIELSGIMDPIFPPPSPPVNFDGLPDPTVAPTLTKSDSPNGYLPAGTYRYWYAAWKGSPTQATAPSPSADITLSTEDTVTLTYPTIPGADGYLVYREAL